MIKIEDLHKYIGKEAFIVDRTSKPNKVLVRSFSVFMEDGEAKAEIKVSSLDPQKSFYSVTVGNDELFATEAECPHSCSEGISEELEHKKTDCDSEKLPDGEKTLGPILSRVLTAQSIFYIDVYIDYDRRFKARPGDIIIRETSRFEILLPKVTLIAHEDGYDEFSVDLRPEDYGKRNKMFGWSLNKEELYPQPQDYNPVISIEKNLYGDGRDWFRVTFAEFPNMIGGIGCTEEEAVKAGYSMLREELRWLIGEGLGFPLPRNEGCYD